MNDFIDSLSKEQKQMLLESLLSDAEVKVDTDDEEEEFVEVRPRPPKQRVNEDFTVVREENKSTRQKVKAGKNIWVDEGTEHKDKITKGMKRSPRKRPAPKKKTVECNICHKKFKVDENIVYGEYHRCNNCVG